MRTRRAPIGPDGVELSTTRPTASSTRAAAASTASKKRKEPAATPSRSTHSRVPSTRTPLATKNAHSSSQPSSTGLLQPGSDILLANVFNNAAAEEEEEEDEPVKKKSKKAAAAADLAVSPKVSSTRRSLAELVDDALRPVEDQGRVRSTTTRVPQKGGVQNAQKAPSVSSTASGSVKSTSVASLLSNRRNQRGQVKKTVAPTGFYAQAAPPPPLPRATRPTATTDKAALKSNKVATTSRRTLLSSPAPEEEEEEEDDVPATTSSKVSRPPLQAIAPELVPTPKTGPSQARSTSTNTNLSLFSNRPTLAKRRTGMVVWDNDDDDEDEDQDVDDDEDLSDEEDQKKGDQKDVVNLSPGSSDKENRDPLAGQTSLSRTAVGPTTTQRTVAPPPSPPMLGGGTPVRPKGDLKTTKTRTPLTILADIGPSHSTPLSSGKVAKPLSDKKGKGVVREQPSLSIANKPHSSSTTSSGAALLAVPETNTQELSSSIPASDDVFLYAKPSDVVVRSGQASRLGLPPSQRAMDDVHEEEAEERNAVPSDHDEIIRDLGLEPDVPILEDFEMDDSPVDMAGLDDIQWPSHEDAGAALAGPSHAEVDDDDFDFGDAADSEDGVENGKVSYDQENDPFGFFAAEAKLRARRQEERIRQSSEVGQAKVDDVEEEEEEQGRENGEVYGLDLRTEQKAFASSSPVPSDDENEDEDGRVKETRSTLKKTSATEDKDDAPDTSAATAADESQSPVRRSARAQKKKEAVIEISDSESEEQVPINKKKTTSTKTTKGKKKKEEQDSDQYDTDLPPPGFTRSAAEIRRRGAGGMRNGRAQADFVDEPFDSDDERPSRSTSGSSSSFGTKGKGKGKGKGGAAATKEARLSDLVKLLPKRATASTYGSKKGNKGARVTSSQTRKTSNTISTSKASPVRGRGRERSSSVESVSSLPSPKAVLERSKKSRGLDVEESDKEEDVFSADSGEEEEEQRASAKTKGRTATRSKVAAASSSSVKAKATAKVQAGTTKGKKKKAGALPEWCNEKKEEEEDGVKARSVSSSSRKRRRGDDVEEEEEKSSGGESESEVEEVVEVKNGGRKAKQAKVAAPSKGKGKSIAKETGAAKKTGALGKKRVPSKTQVDRPRDDLDDFELDTELVI